MREATNEFNERRLIALAGCLDGLCQPVARDGTTLRLFGDWMWPGVEVDCIHTFWENAKTLPNQVNLTLLFIRNRGIVKDVRVVTYGREHGLYWFQRSAELFWQGFKRPHHDVGVFLLVHSALSIGCKRIISISINEIDGRCH